jgi:hypothetical protein
MPSLLGLRHHDMTTTTNWSKAVRSQKRQMDLFIGVTLQAGVTLPSMRQRRGPTNNRGALLSGTKAASVGGLFHFGTGLL